MFAWQSCEKMQPAPRGDKCHLLAPGCILEDGIIKMELTVDYIGGVAFRAKARNHEILCDQPPAFGGQDTAMTPAELLLASLGTCAGFFAIHYLKTRNLPHEGVSIKVSAEKTAERPFRLDNFTISVTVPGLEDERHRENVLRAVNACLVHQTLEHPPKVEIQLASGDVKSLAEAGGR
jgi:putative redox protein